MLQRDHIHVIDIQEIGGAAIGFDILLGQFEADTGWVVVACFGIVDGQRDARSAFILISQGFTKIGGKCGDAALPREVIPDKSNSF